MRHLKSFFLIVLSSIIIACSIPQFSISSKAISPSIYATQNILLYLTTYFASRGYSIVHDNGGLIPTVQDLLDSNLDRQGQIIEEIALSLDSFGSNHNLPDLGRKFLAAITAALATGALIISPTVRNLIDEYLEYTTANGTITVGNTYNNISTYFHEANFQYTFSYYGGSYSVSSSVETIPVCAKADGSGRRFVFILPANLADWEYIAPSNIHSIPDISYSPSVVTFTNVSYQGSLYNIPYIVMSDANPSSNTDVYYYSAIANNQTIIPFFFADFYAGNLDKIVSNTLVMSQLDDTSSSDLLSSSNIINQDGSVEGNTTIYLLTQEALVELLDNYNEGEISYDDLINALGLSSVADNASVADKEEALSSVAVPDSTYSWITKTEWGAQAITETTTDLTKTHAEEDSIADSIGDKLKGGNNSEDDNEKNRGKGLLAALLIGLGIWSTPIIAGDPSGESDSGGTDDGSDDDSHPGYLQDTIAGMAITGSIMDSFFTAAGGSDGYGFVYTVGASFVIFSVIIGAANYFGALFHGEDTKQMSKSSAKNNSPNKNRKNSSYSNKNGIVT